MIAEDDRNPIQVAYERRNLDPQLVWRGKDHQDWPDPGCRGRLYSSRRR